MNLETEMTEFLFNEMNDFIELNSELDRKTLLSSALSNFLFQNGCEDRNVIENYLNDLFNQSDS